MPEPTSEPVSEPMPEPPGDGRLDDRTRVLRAFVKDGRLVAIPSQHKKQLVVLEFLLDACFAEDRHYPEAEVNERLRRFNEDTAALRRYLVVEGFLTRDAGIYRRATRAG